MSHILHLAHGITGHLLANLSALGSLYQKVQLAKHLLSTNQSAIINVELADEAGSSSFLVTQQEFEAINYDLFLKTLGPVDAVMATANTLDVKIDKVSRHFNVF